MDLNDITQQLDDTIPQNAENVLDNIQLDNLSFSDIYHDIVDSIIGEILIPKDLIVSLVVIILITALIQSFNEVTKSKKLFEMISILVCIKVLIVPISNLITNIQSVILSNGAFINSFNPIFTSIMVATGSISTSATYGAFTYIACQLWVQFADKLILPFMSICLGLCCVNSLCREISLGEIIKLIKKYINWFMTVSMFLFSGILSLQSSITNLSDRVSSKAIKFMVSNGVPIVGNAVSDICENVRASMLLIKSGVGFIGIIVLMISVIPPILNVGLVRIVISLGETLSDILGIECIKRLLSDISAILSIVFSCAICFAITFVISIGAMMLLINS